MMRRNPRRRNPEGDVSLTLWARPKGQTDALYEQPIYTVGRTMEDVERVKKLAAKDGWHTFRVQRIDLSKPYNAQQEFAATVRGSRRRNPAPVVAYIKHYGDWYSANERQWASLVAAGVSGKVWNLRHLATPLKSRPTSRRSTAIPVIEPLDFVTPAPWLEADDEVRRMQTVLARPRSRRNPAPTRAEIVERADISIENGMGSETMTALEDMLDGYDGDNIRARFYVGWRDSDLQALLDELGTRNVRRRNPRKRDQSDAQAQVLHLFATASVGAGRELDAFATRLGRGEALSALDIEDAAIAAEARLEDAEYELKTNRIAEYRAGLREERDQFRQLLAAIKALKPSRGAR